MARQLSRHTNDEAEERDVAEGLRVEADTTTPGRTLSRTRPAGSRPGGSTGPSGRSSILSRHRTEGGGLASVAEKLGNRRDFDSERLTLKPEVQVVKFLESDPYAAFRQHWVQAAPKRKSFVCLTLEEGCPICAYEIDLAVKEDRKPARPAFKSFWNVAVLSSQVPRVQRLEAGAILFDQIVAWSEQDRTNPPNKEGLYWGLSRRQVVKGGQESWVFSMEPIKERDLSDPEWDLEPLTEQDMADLNSKLFTENDVQVDDHDTLADLIDEISASRKR